MKTRGIQLLELTIAMVITSLLVSGMSASILIASRAATLASGVEEHHDLTDGGLMRLRRDLQLASEVSGAATDHFSLSLHGSDGSSETRDYSWAGAGHPLRLSKNNGAQVAITSELQQFGMQWDSTKRAKPYSTFSQDGQYEFVSHVVQQRSLLTGAASIDLPETYEIGDLLIAAIAIGRDTHSNLSTNEGWTLCGTVNNQVNITLAVYYSTSLPSGFSCDWRDPATCELCVAHFRRPSSEPVSIVRVMNEYEAYSSQIRVGVIGSQPAGRLVIRASGASISMMGLGDGVSGVPGCSVITMNKTVGVAGLGLIFASRLGSLPEETFDYASPGRCASATVVIGQ